MLVVISPAKRLDWAPRDVAMTEPEFGEDAVRLARTMRNLPLRDLKALMSLRQISTLKEIAQQADCALSHLSTTYRGEATMTAMIIQRICVAFGLDRSEFFRMGEGAGGDFG